MTDVMSIVAVLTAASSLIAVICSHMRKSRCTHIECCCCDISREIEDNKNADESAVLDDEAESF